MRINSRRWAQKGCGITVLGDAQNPAEYGSKLRDLVGPVLVLDLLKYLPCCQRGKQQMRNGSLIENIILDHIIDLDYLFLSSV